ncbi:MAG: MBL fold metallo-hydrolase [Bacillota bacterium]|jgi:phosphoribosyl 1,2-cyclic phosphate phosphodiesterase|nr:MBL fold metallo-hydrolase [Bacillota bacterium]HHT90045.1 MBL fold metallo-hydrolase [Bacillota bacterium]
MEITFLGTGTSHGVPVITCGCAVCQSRNPKNKRTRSSLWIRNQDTDLLIDTATEFRLQALKAKIQKVDGVLYTHCHADHVFGFDDLRVFSKLTGRSIPIYGNEPTISELREVFSYVFRKTQVGGGKPQVETIVVEEPFRVQNLLVQPIPVFHGTLPIFGYRLGQLAYITDCSYIPPSSLDLLLGLDTLILGVIRHEPHPTHMHMEQALDLASKLGAKRTYFTHISHLLEHEEISQMLPEGISLAYDGLTVRI